MEEQSLQTIDIPSTVEAIYKCGNPDAAMLILVDGRQILTKRLPATEFSYVGNSDGKTLLIVDIDIPFLTLSQPHAIRGLQSSFVVRCTSCNLTPCSKCQANIIAFASSVGEVSCRSMLLPEDAYMLVRSARSFHIYFPVCAHPETRAELAHRVKEVIYASFNCEGVVDSNANWIETSYDSMSAKALTGIWSPLPWQKRENVSKALPYTHNKIRYTPMTREIANPNGLYTCAPDPMLVNLELQRFWRMLERGCPVGGPTNISGRIFHVPGAGYFLSILPQHAVAPGRWTPLAEDSNEWMHYDIYYATPPKRATCSMRNLHTISTTSEPDHSTSLALYTEYMCETDAAFDPLATLFDIAQLIPLFRSPPAGACFRDFSIDVPFVDTIILMIMASLQTPTETITAMLQHCASRVHPWTAARISSLHTKPKLAATVDLCVPPPTRALLVKLLPARMRSLIASNLKGPTRLAVAGFVVHAGICQSVETMKAIAEITEVGQDPRARTEQSNRVTDLLRLAQKYATGALRPSHQALEDAAAYIEAYDRA